VIAKLVVARPLGCLVLAMPYRHRQTTEHVSIPPTVLAYARKSGAVWWIVRHDAEGRCSGLPLAEVEATGWLRPSEGRPEWFVPMTAFRPLAWQTWDYAEAVVRLDDESDPAPQLRLL
jgi:hypothetical protein